MKALYFVRHGQSRDNAASVLSRPDSPLTDLGRGQALATANKIKAQGLKFDLIVLSSLPRAVETGWIIIDAIGHPKDAIEVNDLFAERYWGELAGTPSSHFYNGSLTPADIDNAAGAEKLEDAQNRAAQALAYLRTKPHPDILLVGHGAFGRCLRRVINGEPHTNEYLPNLVRYQNAEIARLL